MQRAWLWKNYLADILPNGSPFKLNELFPQLQPAQISLLPTNASSDNRKSKGMFGLFCLQIQDQRPVQFTNNDKCGKLLAFVSMRLMWPQTNWEPNNWIAACCWGCSLRWRIMGAIASQITSLTIVYSTVYSDADQRKHQSSASLAFVRGIHRAGEFPAQMASNAENVSIWWRHHVVAVVWDTCILIISNMQ